MLNRKSWALLAATAAVALGGVAKAESVSTVASAENLTLTRPVALQAAPVRTPLMKGFDAIGLGKTLDDTRLSVGGYASASATYYADPGDSKEQVGRGFDLENQDPTINQIGLFVERLVDTSKAEFDIGGRMEWIWGGDARFIHSTGLFDYYGFGNGPDEQFDLVQAYVDVVLPFMGKGLNVRTGKFITPAGVETINPATTPLYSRGLLFTYLLPYTHTGIYATYSCTENWVTGLGVIRGWDDALEDKNSNGVSVLATSAYKFADSKTDLLTHFTAGPEFAGSNGDYRYLLNNVLKHKWSDQWTFAVEADALVESDQDSGGPSDDYGFAGGLGGWASYMYSQYVTVNARLEYLYDGSGFRVSPGGFVVDDAGDTVFVEGQSNNLYSAALGLTITPFPTDEIGANLKIRPEVRYDYAQNGIFSPNAEGGQHNQLSFAIEAYFTF